MNSTAGPVRGGFSIGWRRRALISSDVLVGRCDVLPPARMDLVQLPSWIGPFRMLVLSFGYSGQEFGLSAFVEQAGELEFA